jgi:hypothetical protein
LRARIIAGLFRVFQLDPVPAVKHPQTTALSGYLPETWWREPWK